MHQLATIFNSLRQGNGEPDEEARRVALDSLLEHLSLPEIRRIRVQLGSHPLCDFCDFPLELIIRIFALLPLEDALALRRVSHKWNNVLSSTEFCHGLTKTHFRPEWNLRNKTIAAGDQQKHEETIKNWFQSAAIARIRRSHGHYHSMAMYWHHMSPGEAGLEPHFFAQSQYSNGRLGLKFDRSTIRVKDLRSNSEDRMYIDENREPFEKWLLSDKYLICLKASPYVNTTLFAWALDSTRDEQPYRVRLPSKVLNISASQNRVAIVTTGYDVYIWTIGGPLRPLDTSRAKNELQFTTTHLVVVWDPEDDTHFFVVFEGFIDQEIIFAILRIFHGRETVWVVKFVEYSSEGRRPPRITALEAGTIGIFNLSGLIRAYRNGDIISKDAEDPFMLTFNGYNGSFEISQFPLAASVGEDVKNNWPHMVSQLHFWRDQVLIPLYGQRSQKPRVHSHHADKGIDGALVVSLSASSAELTNPTQIPRYSDQLSGDCKTSLLPDSSSDSPSSIVYCWGAGAEFADAQKPHRGENPINYSRSIMGDDDFVVLCGHYGFVVWCFDLKVELPTASRWAESDVPIWEEPGASASVRAFHPLA